MAPVSKFVTYIYCSYLLHTFREISSSSFYSWRSSKVIENRAFIFLACTLKWDCQWLCSTSGMFTLTLPAELCELEFFFFLIENPNKYGFQVVKCFSLFVIDTKTFIWVPWEVCPAVSWIPFLIFSLSFGRYPNILNDFLRVWHEILCHVNCFNCLVGIIAIYHVFFLCSILHHFSTIFGKAIQWYSTSLDFVISLV